MEVKVRNFRGCERADIKVSPIALLAGQNGAGKSSAAQAIAAATTGCPIPFLRPSATKPGEFGTLINKGDADILVRRGSKKGEVAIVDAQGTSTVAWPKAEFATKGDVSMSSVYAAGIIDIMDLGERVRARVVGDLINAEPTRKDVEQYLKDAEAPPSEKVLDLLMESIRDQGWDATHKAATEKGVELKGKWQDATGNKRYGSTVAADWQPEGWDDGLVKRGFESLEMDYQAAQSKRDEALKSAAVDEAEVKRLQEAIDAAPSEEGVKALAATVEEKRGALKVAQDAYAELPDADPLSLPCPHCQGKITIQRKGPETKLIATEDLSSDEIKKRRNAKIEADHAVTGADREFKEAESALNDANDKVKAAGNAKKKLDGRSEKAGQSLQAAEEELKVAKQQRDVLKSYLDASKFHRAIQANQIYIDMLGPEGVRKVVLVRALNDFNKLLKNLSNEAQWGIVTLNEDLGLEYDAKPYILLSKSEQYRARATLQVAIAMYTESGMVILDDAEILFRENKHKSNGRNGLITMVVSSQVPAIIGMSFNGPEQVPDASAVGGISYWFDEGIAVTLEEAKGK